MFRLALIFSFLLIVVYSCRQQGKTPSFGSNDISAVVTRMTEIMVHDVTNPPLAARFFSYVCLAGYEVVAQSNAKYAGMHRVLNMYPDIHKPDSLASSSYQLAALLAMMETAKKLQPSGGLMEEFETRFLDSCRQLNFSEETIQQSQKYAIFISREILAYAKSDGYNKISNYSRYTPVNKEGSWYPTPPAFLPAVEPYFNKVRPFTLDSCTQFKPLQPVAFSQDKDSDFYKLMLLNYNEKLSQEHRVIAAFWDCNPFAVQNNGHLLIGLKKISPGAHWMGITGIACNKAKKDFNECMQIYTLVSIGLMDAFICCWDEKFRSNRIRPETAIRKYIDPAWTPLLQTPPFPEYVSGHSVISSSSAVILTQFFGDHFSYTDNVEVTYGLPSRRYKSFKQAAEEAAVSRFYGGIHFMDAINNGTMQGVRVGNLVLDKFNKSHDE